MPIKLKIQRVNNQILKKKFKFNNQANKNGWICQKKLVFITYDIQIL